MKVSYVTLAAIVLSVIILVIITSVSGINPAVILTLGPLFLLGAIASVLLRLLFQGLRFNYILRSFSERRYGFLESVAVRIGSEFVAQTSVAYVGGEVARAAWMAKNGEASGKALWLPYIEIVFDVFAGNCIGVVAGVIAILSGDSFLGGIVLVLSLFILSLVTSVVLLSRKRFIHMPSLAMTPLRWVVGERRATGLFEKGNAFMAEFCEAATHTFTRRNSVKLIVIGACTAVMVLLTVSTLWLVALGLGLPLSFVDCAPLVYTSIVLGNLPITLGGSGVAEAGIYFYASAVFNVSSWPMVFAWRILSYHFVLLITGIPAFVILRRYTK